MEPIHPLKALLQLQLASDAYAVTHLPYVLSTLNSECFAPSPHLQLWTARISSLLHSKIPASRWAGLCIAHKTSTLSKSSMIECSQSWLGVALPMFSKNEPTPTIKAAVRLLRKIFTAAKDVPEFQRQVATPNVSKFSLILIGLAQNHADMDLKIVSLSTLAQLVPHYPTLHKSLHSSLSSLSSKFLEGSAPAPIDEALLHASSRLSAVLYLTGGKVGAAGLWRKSVNEAMSSAWCAFLALRSAFLNEERNHVQPHHPMHTTDDPLTSIPLKLDCLRCCVVLLCDLAKSTTHRAVQVPIGPLVKLATALLCCTKEDKLEEHADPAVRAMEISIIPAIWKLACDLINCLAICTERHLTPHVSRIVSYIAFHLEQKLQPSQRLFILQTLQVILTHYHPLSDPLVPNRLARAILPSLSIVLAVRSETSQNRDNPSGHTTKKGKKRARGYEGGEVFKVSREVICFTSDEGEVVLAALDVIQLVLRNPNLSPAMAAVSCRVLLSMLLALPQMSPASLSPDLSLYRRLSRKVQNVCTMLSSGTTSHMSKCINLVIGAVIADDSNDASSGPLREFDILLHPRLPPLVRSTAEFESLLPSCRDECPEKIDSQASFLGQQHSLQTTTPSPIVVNENTDGQRPQVPSQPVLHLGKSPPEPPNVPPVMPVAVEQVMLTRPDSSPALEKPPTPSIPEASQTAVQDRQGPSVSRSVVVLMDEDEDLEEMPAIDMESDSD